MTAVWLRSWPAVLAVGLLALMLVVLSLGPGSAQIPPQTTLAALLQFDPGNSDHLLVRELRVPRTVLALVVGAALAAAGVIMQALTRNPLADPGVLGVNAGAATAVAAGIALAGMQSAPAQLLCGLLGAALAGAVVVLLSGLRSGADPIRVVLVGTALSAVLLALTQLITLNSEEQVFDQFRHWAVGSLQGWGTAVLLALLLPGITVVLIDYLLDLTVPITSVWSMIAQPVVAIAISGILVLILARRYPWWLLTSLAGCYFLAAVYVWPNRISEFGLTPKQWVWASFVISAVLAMGLRHYLTRLLVSVTGGWVILTLPVIGMWFEHTTDNAWVFLFLMPTVLCSLTLCCYRRTVPLRLTVALLLLGVQVNTIFLQKLLCQRLQTHLELINAVALALK